MGMARKNHYKLYQPVERLRRGLGFGWGGEVKPTFRLCVSGIPTPRDCSVRNGTQGQATARTISKVQSAGGRNEWQYLREGNNDEVGAIESFVLHQVGDEGDGLDGLAEPHFVG